MVAFGAAEVGRKSEGFWGDLEVVFLDMVVNRSASLVVIHPVFTEDLCSFCMDVIAYQRKFLKS